MITSGRWTRRGPDLVLHLGPADSSGLQQELDNEAGQPTLRRGSKGAAVSTLQSRLRSLNFDPGPIDGDFGPLTEAAVRSFQGSRRILVDGIVGPQTWGQLSGGGGSAPPPSAAVRIEAFPIAGHPGQTPMYNVGYDARWNNFDPRTAFHNSDFSLTPTNASHPSGHLGVDIFAPRGQPVVAPVTGTVSAVGRIQVGGNRVTITQGSLSFYHAHLDTIAPGIRSGMAIRAGTPIGTVGNTGSAVSTAPHVHFSIYRNGNYRNSVDPFPALLRAHRANFP